MTPVHSEVLLNSLVGPLPARLLPIYPFPDKYKKQEVCLVLGDVMNASSFVEFGFLYRKCSNMCVLHHLELHISRTNVSNGTLQSFLKINQCGLFCRENTKWRMMLELQQGLEMGEKGVLEATVQWLSGEGSQPGRGQVVELWEAKLRVRSGGR